MEALGDHLESVLHGKRHAEEYRRDADGNLSTEFGNLISAMRPLMVVERVTLPVPSLLREPVPPMMPAALMM